MGISDKIIKNQCGIDQRLKRRKEKRIQLDEGGTSKKKKKITIDSFFDVNSNFNHFLVIEKEEIWHRIRGNDNREYMREIRLESRLFDVKQEMIECNYQPNPSPFVIPNLLALDA